MREARGKIADKALLTHSRREYFHAALHLIFDEEFIHAYQYGVVMTFPDQISRRVFPRLITYAADYPEKSIIGSHML
jgi:hypothetical protein